MGWDEAPMTASRQDVVDVDETAGDVLDRENHLFRKRWR